MSPDFEFLMQQVEGGLTDGVIESEDIIKACKGKIDRFKITVSDYRWKNVPKLRDAIDYLVSEWDYSLNKLTK